MQVPLLPKYSFWAFSLIMLITTYVLGAQNMTFTAVTPAPIQIAEEQGKVADIWLALLNAPDINATKELVFSGVKGTISVAQKVVIKNVGTSTLSISSFILKGTHASAFKLVNLPAVPLSIAVGQSKTIQVAFAPGSLTGVLSAALQISTNDPDESKKNVGLYGLSAKGEQGSNEPTLHQIVQTLGYKINVGGTGLILGTSAAPIGDEVLVPLFQKAGSGTVKIKPVARYSPDDLLPFGYYTLSDSKPVHHQMAVVNVGYEQNLNPAIVSGGKSSFDPGNAVFGFYVNKTSYARYNNYTQDKLNMGATKHAARIYPLKNRNGQSLANSYLIAFEPAANGDYQDYVFIVENVKPASVSTPKGLITNVSVTNGKTYNITTMAAQKNYYTDRTYVVTSLPDYLKGAAAIKTANDDKTSTSASLVSFTLTKPATVYVAYDPRSSSLPSWLSGWAKLSGRINVTDVGTGYLALYSKKFSSGKVTLGGNMTSPAVGAKTNYIIAATESSSDNILKTADKYYEAEDALLKGALVAAKHTGYSGRGYVDYVNADQDYIQWTVKAEMAGDAALAIGYANGGNSDRSMVLTVNGKTVNSNVSFLPTGSWTKWSSISVKASLTAGNNLVKLQVKGASGPNVDYLSVSYNNSPGAKEKIVKEAKEKTVKEAKPQNVVGQTAEIYPNPASTELVIAYTSFSAQQIRIIITDANAKIVKEVSVWVQPGMNQIHLPAADMNNGMYFVSMVSANNKISRKIIVAKF